MARALAILIAVFALWSLGAWMRASVDFDWKFRYFGLIAMLLLALAWDRFAGKKAAANRAGLPSTTTNAIHGWQLWRLLGWLGISLVLLTASMWLGRP